MNKWRLLLFSVFGLLQITTSDRNFINGRYSCCDHSQRYSESDTRVIAYEPYRLYQDIPDLQQRKLLGRPLPARGQEIDLPTRNVRHRGQLLQDRSDGRQAYDQRASKERKYDYRHSQQDETRPENFGKNRGKLILHSRFMDASRYAHMFNNDDQVNRETKNMRQSDTNNHQRVRRDLDRDLRNNERFVRESRTPGESVIKIRRHFYTKSISENILQITSRNIDPIIREDHRLSKRNTQIRSRSVSEENLRFVEESTEINENQIDRRISKRYLDSSRHSISEQLRRERKTRIRSTNLDPERLFGVRRQVFTLLRTMNRIGGHIKYSRELNHIYETDNYRITSRGLRSVRNVETCGSGQIIEQGVRRERDISNIRTKRDDREVSDIRRERNEPREHRVHDNFDSRQNGNNIRDMQKIRELTDIRSQRIILREKRDDKNKSRNLLILIRYRYSKSHESISNRNRVLEINRRYRSNTRHEQLVYPQTDIRREKNIIREANNRHLNVRRQDTSMINNRIERYNREVTNARKEKEAVRGGIRVSRRQDSSRLSVHNENLHQDVSDIKHEENIIRENNSRQARYNNRQLVKDVSRVNIRNEPTRELDDARRERREVRENSEQYTLSIREGRPAARHRTVTTLRRLDVQRSMNTINEQLLKTKLENVQDKQDFRRQERDMSREHRYNDRTLNIHNTQDNRRHRLREMSVRREHILNIFRNNRDNLAELGRNTQRIHKRQNVRQVLANDDTINIDDTVYDSNDRENFRISSRNIRESYNVQNNNRLSEMPYRRESQRVEDTLSFRRDERDKLRTRSIQTYKQYRTRENNERLLRTIQERLSTYRDETKMAVRSDEPRRTRLQIVTETRENRDSRERSFNIRTIRGERDGEDSDARRDLSRIIAIAEDRSRISEKNIRFVPMTYKPDTLTFEMKWQYLFYTLQAIYLLSLLTKVPQNEEGKNKLRIITWLTPAKTVKMD